MPYNTKEKRRDYARIYQQRRRAEDETYRLVQNRRAREWDGSPEQRPYKLLRAAKVRAKRLGHTFLLTRDWVDYEWDGYCALTGIEFVLSGKRTLFSPSIDRIDSTTGYVPANCRFILWGVNAFKSNGTDDDIYNIAKALIKTQEERELRKQEKEK